MEVGAASGFKIAVHTREVNGRETHDGSRGAEREKAKA